MSKIPEKLLRVVDADFHTFMVLWNQAQGVKTPHIHVRIAHWLEQAWTSGDRKLLLMAFRSCGKSTLVGLFAAWLLYRQPDLRILVLAADMTLAAKMVRNVKRVIERHALTRHLKPRQPDQWASDRFSVSRERERRDPSMMAAGIGSNITGSRADIIICDDVEVPNTCDSAEKRESLRERLSELAYVQEDAQAMQIYIGTPHTYYTIYADRPRVDLAEERAFLEGYKRLEIPLLDGEGNSIWPERYSAADIAQIRRESGPNKFASQMLLQPMNIHDARLDPDLLVVYGDEIDYTPELRSLFIMGRKMVGASAWWDPSLAKAKSDGSVLAVIYADDEGNFYLHRVAYLRVDKHSDVDDATQQCRAIADIAKELMLPSVAVETNGVGGLLPRMLQQQLMLHGNGATMRPQHTSENKSKRIVEAFDAPLAARRLHVHKSVLQTRFLQEMREWKPYAKNNRDDGLDAVAGALGLQPLRIRMPERRHTKPRWVTGEQYTRIRNGDEGFEV